MSSRRRRPRPSLQRDPTHHIGRAGTLAIQYVHDGSRTVFGRTKSQTPWHLFPPIYLDESGAAYTLLLNPSGGLVGGDHLRLDIRLETGTHVLVSTPAANRVYRSLSEESFQEITLSLAPRAILEWFPEQTIPFAESRFRQSIEVTLARGATVLLWDAVASGRIARGERWAFTSLCNDIRVVMPTGATIRERYDINPGSVGLAGDWDYVASLFIVGDGADSATRDRLESELAMQLDGHKGALLGGVSRPEGPAVAVKLVARSAHVLTEVSDRLRHTVRRVLWGLPAVTLRKY
ncbi:putative urease accessory protein UreD [Nitrospira sp. KM1]|uniref:urease accessory protein UreD n=1 Tax=Nitrospira sp. KM1 TaxID=1936990 RepID=UPI0013A74891|nr:urease accessory protein UreD [Nitrospira sp. KM1]BCA56785.1 putative urease accessory protein UreD [Nitrospira sp. KM1]